MHKNGYMSSIFNVLDFTNLAYLHILFIQCFELFFTVLYFCHTSTCSAGKLFFVHSVKLKEVMQ